MSKRTNAQRAAALIIYAKIALIFACVGLVVGIVATKAQMRLGHDRGITEQSP